MEDSETFPQRCCDCGVMVTAAQSWDHYLACGS